MESGYVFLCLLFVVSVHALHTEEVKTAPLTMDEYLDQVTQSVEKDLRSGSILGNKPPYEWAEKLQEVYEYKQSVDSELADDSMMGHKPPNRWYMVKQAPIQDTRSHGDALQSQMHRVERGLAIILSNHFDYMIKVRRQLKHLNNMYPNKMDLWPIHQALYKEGADNDTHRLLQTGYQQPEWMNGLFDELEGIRLEYEEMMEQ